MAKAKPKSVAKRTAKKPVSKLTVKTKAGTWKSYWQATRASIKFFGANWKILVWVTAIVALPTNLLTLGKSLSGDATVSAYVSLATVLMSLALIWTVLAKGAGEKVKARDAYYFGTAKFVVFLLVALALALQLLPFIIGAAIFVSAIYGSNVSISQVDWVLLVALWVALAVPSFYLLTHYVLAPLEVVSPTVQTPLQALRASRALTRGKGWRVFGQLLLFGVSVILAVAIPTVLFVWLYVLTHGGQIFLTLLQIVISLVFLPYSYVYLYQLRFQLTREQ